MASWPLALGSARILITNDDGVHAPGIEVLERIARGLSNDVWIVAPEVEQSGAGHSLTLRRPLKIRQREERRYAVDGTPTDCVLLAINEIMKDHRPDLVLSGVNRGANIGEDITYSGTVSAAIEATILGVPAIALSQEYAGDGPVHWDTAEQFAPRVIDRLVARGWSSNTLININFPPVEPSRVTAVKATAQGRRKMGDEILRVEDPRGAPYYWIGPVRHRTDIGADTDVRAMAEGVVSVTPVDLDFTDHETLATLGKAFA